MAKSRQTEHQIQSEFFYLLEMYVHKWPGLAYAFAIPNGGARSAVTGARLKREGVKPGVPDVFVPIVAGGYSGLFIEFKTENGRISEAQREYHSALEMEGYKVIIKRTAVSAIRAVLDYCEKGKCE